MKRWFILIAIVACTNEERATRTLVDQGYTHVVMTGRRWSACSDSDATCDGFKAISPAGHAVSGAVGCGAGCSGKGCTIRFD